eukprot:12087356-Ditylum_brightwellii.AAC.1
MRTNKTRLYANSTWTDSSPLGYRISAFPPKDFSNHYAIWAAFDPEILFLGDIGSAVDPAARKLKSVT